MGDIGKTTRCSLKTLARHPRFLVPYILFQGLMTVLGFLILARFLDIYGSNFYSAEMVFWQFINYFFLLFLAPLIEGWTYSSLVTFFKEGRISLMEGLMRGARKYLGFMGLEIIYYASTFLLLFPFIVLIFFVLVGISLQNRNMTSGIMLMMISATIIILLIFTMSIAVQSMLAYMKPVYAFVGNFFESFKEGLIAARRNFGKTIVLLLTIYAISCVLYIPSFLFLFGLLKDILARQITIYSLSSIHFPLWFIMDSFIVGLVSRILIAAFFTHFYLDYRKWI